MIETLTRAELEIAYDAIVRRIATLTDMVEGHEGAEKTTLEKMLNAAKSVERKLDTALA